MKGIGEFGFLKAPNAKFVGISPHKLAPKLVDFIVRNPEVEMPDAAHLWLFYSVSRAMGANIAMGPVDGLFRVSIEVDGEEMEFNLVDEEEISKADVTRKKGFVDLETAQILQANVQPMAALMFQLVGCMQVKPLEKRNLKGYHASSGDLPVFADELDAIRYVSALTPKIAGTDGFRTLREDKKFIAYHSTATSSPTLVLEAHSAMPYFMKELIDESDLAACRKAKDDFASLESASKISSKAMAVAWLWFEATGQDRGGEKWIQGKRAVDELPPHFLIKVRAAMKLFIKEQKVVDDEQTPQSIIESLVGGEEKL